MADIRPTSGPNGQPSPEPRPADERPSRAILDLHLRLERRSEKYVVLYLKNDFVSQNCYLFDEALGRLLPAESGLRIELDMSQVPYADSASLGRILFWSKKFAQGGGALAVVNPTPYVMDIIENMHLDEVVETVHRRTTPPPEV